MRSSWETTDTDKQYLLAMGLEQVEQPVAFPLKGSAKGEGSGLERLLDE